MKIILFDLDGVINYSERFSDQYCKRTSISLEDMAPFFKEEMNQALINHADLKELLKKHLSSWKWEGSIEEFLELWFTLENHPSQKVLDKIQELREKGVKCYLATNQEKYRIEFIEKTIGNYFNGIFSSCSLQVKKKDPLFFEKVLHELSADPSSIIFFDDTQKNLDAAKVVGITAIFSNTEENILKELEKLN